MLVAADTTRQNETSKTGPLFVGVKSVALWRKILFKYIYIYVYDISFKRTNMLDMLDAVFKLFQMY